MKNLIKHEIDYSVEHLIFEGELVEGKINLVSSLEYYDDGEFYNPVHVISVFVGDDKDCNIIFHFQDCIGEDEEGYEESLNLLSEKMKYIENELEEYIYRSYSKYVFIHFNNIQVEPYVVNNIVKINFIKPVYMFHFVPSLEIVNPKAVGITKVDFDQLMQEMELTV